MGGTVVLYYAVLWVVPCNGPVYCSSPVRTLLMLPYTPWSISAPHMLGPGSIIVPHMSVPGPVIVPHMPVPGSILVPHISVPGSIIVPHMAVPGSIIVPHFSMPRSIIVQFQQSGQEFCSGTGVLSVAWVFRSGDCVLGGPGIMHTLGSRYV